MSKVCVYSDCKVKYKIYNATSDFAAVHIRTELRIAVAFIYFRHSKLSTPDFDEASETLYQRKICSQNICSSKQNKN